MTGARPPAHRVVIVGGGAGGLPLAAGLGRKHRRRGDVHVALVDPLPTHVWKPLLHEVAAGRMDADAHEIEYAALAYRCGFTFRQGAMIGLDRARRSIRVAPVHDEDGEEILPERELPYDTLVIAVGSESNDFNVPGVAAHAIPIDTPVDAERFHRKLLAASMRANARKGQAGEGHVDIVIIGAGATGVELAAEIRQTTKMHAAYGLDRLDPLRDVRITLVEAAPRILPPLSEAIATAASALLERLSVDVRVARKVTEVTPNAVHAGSEVIPADLVAWAAGIRAPAWLAGLDGLETNRANQLVARTTLQTTRDDDVFALGDCAACPWPEAGREGAILPPRAQVAHQQAEMLVRTVAARVVAGGSLPVFRFRDYGSLVSLGELSAVGNLMGRLVGRNLFVQGLIARLMYASLYKLHQRSLHGTLAVALDTLGRFLRGRVEPRVKLH